MAAGVLGVCCTRCGIAHATAVWLGYVALYGIVLVRSIQALSDSGESNCTEASFKWLWWICVSSAFFVVQELYLLLRNPPNHDVIDHCVVVWAMSLGVGIATQSEFLDGCGGKAHTAMYIYMWGNYTVAAVLALCGVISILCDTLCPSGPSGPSGPGGPGGPSGPSCASHPSSPLPLQTEGTAFAEI